MGLLWDHYLASCCLRRRALSSAMEEMKIIS